MIRILFTLSTSFAPIILCGQASTINWTFLAGKWECEKVILVRKINMEYKDKDSSDISIQYRPYLQYYETAGKFKDEYPYQGNYTSVDGIYKIDRAKKTISYSSMIQTTKYSGGKVAVPDLVFSSGKQAYSVITLTEDYLVLVQKYIPDTELQGDYIFYMKKAK